MKPSFSRVSKYLSYNPITGVLKWIAAPSPNKKSLVGKIAGMTNSNGYIVIKIFGKSYGAHRLAWLLMTKKWPPEDIDHDNLARGDNRWQNLRLGGGAKNAWNRPIQRNNALKFKGVTKYKDRFRNKPYMAKITVGKKPIYLGYFATPEEAHEAYLMAAKKHFGKYARAQ